MGPPKTSTKAVVGFVLSLLPCALAAIPGLVLSIIARGEIKRSNGTQTGGGLALAGIILASVWLSFGTLGMLAAIAIPNFIKFQARSKQVEAKANLKSMAVALRGYAEDHRGTTPSTFAQLGVRPEAGYYTYYIGNGDRVLPTKGEGVAAPADLDLGDAVVYAVGNIDADDYLDVWILDSHGQLRQLQDDVSNTTPREQL
jgi:type II secretory pathway pseudopilin PulG